MAQQYTRKVIRDAFVQMLNERPLNKITVKDIVTVCEINRNTFYYYYPDLYALLEELFQTEFQKVREEYNASLSWEESFLVATHFALQNKKAIYHVYNSLQKEELEKYLYNVAENVMSRYVEEMSRDIPAADSDKRLIVTFYQSALTEMLLHWIGSGMKEDPEKVIHRIGLLFDGNIALSLQRSASLKDKW
ncbi:TetR-like C-terminal domain-containing protein [Niameybacter massiliensis]|uniref:TetR-like C-terminal domain-containing protein n=1 Tax=Holtiella tumoricola TaxID=3018743 RepID=A0AA42DQ56_9FIRM|nr:MULTISPECIES: TetR-like C-terminal domain-containing protein [Lachnospirales]MDA3733259.1 TetR-like C-terminal domain-containing protein [Holtiella tumoricola]